ncbi:somatostatin receptor type 2-like [Saccoglossus kowalevskii]|uniref:Somatostatin receptor type 3-like n=1 Tax=Saccoglossus kowalevskii TaxID=10224 RepID=A0ABM0H0W8_SACKO|nr:PREDICTED: somatostatin receptor type 3-like [Saccoglossus kowalevskii]
MDGLLENFSASAKTNFTGNPHANLYAALAVAVPIVYGCICILGILGNLLVIFVTVRYKSTGSVPSVYVLNLAAADLLFMIALAFLAYQHAFHEWTIGPIVCKIVIAFDGLNQFTSVYTLTLMSIDRYLAIAHGLRSITFRTVYNARIICFFIWVFSALCVLPLWIYGNIVPEANGTLLCNTNWPYEHFESVYVFYSFGLGFALPLTIIVASYICMLRYLVITKRPSSTQSSKKESKRVAILVFAIVAAFVVCWLPFYVVQLRLALSDTAQSAPSAALVVAFILSTGLSYSNSCINPVIYTFIGRKFRAGFLPFANTICCRRRRRRGRRRVRRTLSGSSDTTYGSKRSSNQKVWSWRDKFTASTMCCLKGNAQFNEFMLFVHGNVIC